ncbi:MAG: nucleoside monophosphate kinase [Chlamydiia bacterium]|nr:nucleoside monophosphate kinase [Chlamydiia bacterium]
MKKYKGILLFGAPGAGKGVISSVIEKALLGFHISMGNIVRNQANEDSKKRASSGSLLGNKEIIDLFENYFNKLSEGMDASKIFIIDGIPRTTKQAEFICDKFDVICVINLYVSEETSISRIQNRSKTSSRKDDKDVDVIKKRYGIYRDLSVDIIKSLSICGARIEDIDAERDILDVAISTLNSIKNNII